MVIITGGAGFIGSSIISLLNSFIFKEIIVVDDFQKSNNWKNLL